MFRFPGYYVLLMQTIGLLVLIAGAFFLVLAAVFLFGDMETLAAKLLLSRNWKPETRNVFIKAKRVLTPTEIA
jgi:hypothetical protein